MLVGVNVTFLSVGFNGKQALKAYNQFIQWSCVLLVVKSCILELFIYKSQKRLQFIFIFLRNSSFTLYQVDKLSLSFGTFQL